MFGYKLVRVKEASMEPILHDNDILLVKTKISRNSLSHNEIIIFKSPIQTNLTLVKRIVAKNGDNLKITNTNIVILNNKPLQFINDLQKKDAWIEYDWVVTFDEFIVLGENLSKSQDSRNFGPITSDCIIGKAVLKIKPFSRIK